MGGVLLLLWRRGAGRLIVGIWLYQVKKASMLPRFISLGQFARGRASMEQPECTFHPCRERMKPRKLVLVL